jgi:sugar phosphate isomerase/epimerase
LDTEWAGIKDYRSRFTFTAHLPDKIGPEHEEIVARMTPLAEHFIIHPSVPEKAETLGRLLCSWLERYGKSRFLVENVYPGRLEALLPHLPHDAGLCMDTGHLLLEGKNPADFYKRYEGRIGEIHLHGVDREKAAKDGRLPDHRPLTAGDSWFRELRPRLEDFTGTVNLEVFSWEETLASINVLL